MEDNPKISYEDMKKIVNVMSEVISRLFPGASLTYQERLMQRGSWDSYDGRGYAVTLAAPYVESVSVRGAVMKNKYGLEQLGRKRLLLRLEADGWPEASSAEEMKLRLAAAGDGVFEGVCRGYMNSALQESAAR